MARPLKPTPDKQCEWCGITFNRKRVGKNDSMESVGNYLRRRFCSLSCSTSAQHATQPSTDAAARKRTRRFIGERCEACGTRDDLCVHHVDGEPKNNAPANLQTLCMSCHGFWHSMLRRTGTPQLQRMPPLIEWASSAPTAMPSSRKSRRSS